MQKSYLKYRESLESTSKNNQRPNFSPQLGQTAIGKWFVLQTTQYRRHPCNILWSSEDTQNQRSSQTYYQFRRLSHKSNLEAPRRSPVTFSEQQIYGQKQPRMCR